ncbi:MAG: hypothetical protein P9L90_03360 [Candidatus Aadella gelida]|nr:hypothetical protein [Candidatus Aadella gelida]
MNKNFHAAYEDSVKLLKSLIADGEYNNIGFFASSVDKENYKRLFSRDAFWVGMAGLLSGDPDLIQGYRSSLETLARNQREDGAIPSNVTHDGKVSYGVINPRVDSTTLFIIGALQYCKRKKISDSGDLCIRNVSDAVSYLENNWENPDNQLLYIPRAGNWADEYLQQGYVLYDEMLWYYVLKGYGEMLGSHGQKNAETYLKKAKKVAKQIRDRFWMKLLKEDGSVYTKKITRLFDLDKEGFFLHFYHLMTKEEKGMGHPHRTFDAFGNILVLMSGLASDEQSEKIRRFIDSISMNSYPLIPAHYPFVPEKHFKTYKLYQYRFKEYIGHYHNGGLWPWYTGLYVSYLAKIGDRERAMKYLGGVLKANTKMFRGAGDYEYHMNTAASVETTVMHEEGISLFMSMIVKNIVLDRKSMVLLKYKRKKVDLSDDMAVRDLRVPKGAEIKITAVGPDAGSVLRDIMELSDKETNCLSEGEIKIKKDKPYGIPSLGVSAAAYVIGYKAVFENNIIFD